MNNADNLPSVIFNDDMDKIYLKTKGLMNYGIDYGKVRGKVVKEVLSATGFDIKETQIKNIRISELVFTLAGLSPDSWIPFKSSDIKIVKYIECDLPYMEEDTP